MEARIFKGMACGLNGIRFLLSPNSSIIPHLLVDSHSSPTGGHFGYERTLNRLKPDIFWLGMRKPVKQHIKECDICQRCKYESTKLAGLLQPLPIPNHI